MSGEEKRRRPAPSATPWDGAGDGELSPAERIVRDCHRDMYRYRHAGAGLVGEADFFNGYDRDACPRCGSPAIEGNGRDANGVRRWRCLSCGRAFNPVLPPMYFPPFTPMIHNRSRQPAPAGYANVFPPLSAPPSNLSRNARASRARALSEPG